MPTKNFIPSKESGMECVVVVTHWCSKQFQKNKKWEKNENNKLKILIMLEVAGKDPIKERIGAENIWARKKPNTFPNKKYIYHENLSDNLFPNWQTI